MPNEGGKPFDKTVNMFSDIGKGVLNLFESKKSEKEPEQIQEPLPPLTESAPIIQKGEERQEEDSSDISPQPEPQMQENSKDASPETPLDVVEIVSPDPVISIAESSTNVSSEPELVEKKSLAPESPSVDIHPEAPAAVTTPEEYEEQSDVKVVADSTTNEQENPSPPAKETNGADESKPVFEVDLGQGNLEDKEMYTTRD